MRVSRTAIVELGIDMALDALEQEMENECSENHSKKFLKWA